MTEYEERERDMTVRSPYARVVVALFLLSLLLLSSAPNARLFGRGGGPNPGGGSCVATTTEQYSAAPADSVGRVYPFAGAYTGADSATITISGTTSGLCISGDVTVGVVADSNHATTVVSQASASLGAGTFTASLSVPAGRIWYVGKVVDNFSTAFQARRWGVGLLVLTIGQSNMNLEKGVTGAAPAADGLSASYYTPINSAVTNDFWGKPAGNGFLQAANHIGPAIGYVVGFTNYAITTTAISSWVTQTAPEQCGGSANGSSWTSLTSGAGGVTNATSGPNIGPDFNAVLWSQGESDAASGTSLATYQAQLAKLVCQLNNLTGRSASTMIFGIDVLGSTTSYSTSTDATWEDIRQAQMTASGVSLMMHQYPNWQANGVLCAGGADQSPHWLQGSGGCFNYYESTGFFQAEGLLAAMGVSGYDGGGLGPSIASVTKTDSTHVTLNLTQQATGTKLCGSLDTLPCTSATGSTLTVFPFKVCVNGTGPPSVCTGGTVETVTATAFTQPNAIVLTVSPAYTPGSDVVTFQYVYGWNGNVTGDVFAFDNFNPFSNPAMPGGPLQPTVGTITAASAFTTPQFFAGDAYNTKIASVNYGATGTYYNGTVHAPWVHTNGDWIDKNGLSQGTVSYASSCSGDLNSSCSSANTGSTPQTWNMPITQLVQEAVASSNQNLEVILRASLARTIADKSTGTPPSILVTYTDTTTDTLACLDNVLLGGSSVPVRTGPFNIATYPLALHFAMPNSGKTVSTAVMTVTNLAQFTGAVTPFVGRVNDPLFPNGVDSAGVHLGVANSYTQDAGLGADPSIYFFSDGSSVSDAFTQSALDGSSVLSYDYGPSPDTAKLPWALNSKFQLQTDTQFGIVTLTGTATSGSPVITGLSSTTSVKKGFWAYDGTFGTVPIDARILSVDSSTQVTLTENSSASGSVSIKFVPGTNTITKTGNLHGNTTIDGIADTSDLTNGMIVFAVEGHPTNGGPAIPYSGSATITIVDANTVTIGLAANATLTGATLIFLPPLPTFSFGTTPVVVPSTYTGHGYTPLGASTGSAFMVRHTKGMETIADWEYRFVPTTDGDQASTYVPGAVADGSNVVIRKTSDLTNAISTVNGSPTVTIHDVGHGASTGDWINFPFQVSIGGIILHDWYPIAVTDADYYTITSTGAWWYNSGVGSRINANATVTNGGAVASFATVSGQKMVTVTLNDHVQHPSHFDAFFVNGSNFSVGGVSIHGGTIPTTSRNDAGAIDFTAQTTNTFQINPQFEWSGGTATSTTSASINGGQVQIKYGNVGAVPWPSGKLPNEIYVRWYMMLGDDFVAPDNAQCNGGKWALGTAHRTTVATNNGACAQCSPAVKLENHYAGGSGWSTRGQFIMGDTPATPEYQKTAIGNYEYDYVHCQNDTIAGVLGTLTPGVWHSIEVHTKMNTVDMTGLSARGAAPTDGLIETFVDGRLALTKAYKWREEPPWNPMLPGQIQVIGDNGIKSIWFNSYFGGVCGIGFEGAFFVKNIAIGRNYIGPMKS